MKRILMLLQSPFPPDIRLEKEIKSLAEVGYSVLVVCNQYEKGLCGEYSYCKIDRVKALFTSKLLNKIVNLPIFFNPRFLIRIYFSIRRFKPDFLHAHDLPMVPLGILFSKFYKVPVISDMHENYPAALIAFQKKGIFNYILKNYRAAKVLEKYCIKRSDRVITVIEENKQRLVNLGANSSKVFVVSNTVDLNTFAKGVINKEIVNKYKGRFNLIYTGFISPERGLDTVVLGMKYLKDKLPNAKLLIVGDGITLPQLSNIVKSTGISDFVEFIKWPGHQNLGSYLEIADVGISPQPYNDHWNNSIPHKLFEYMSQSIPVLVADAIPLKRIINETQAGLFYKTNDPENFAEKVMELVSSEIDYGSNGLRAVKYKYNWKQDANVLISLYNGLTSDIVNI